MEPYLDPNRSFTDFSPLGSGWEHCAPGHSYGPHIRHYYLIHYVFSGTGRFENPRGCQPVSAGQAFLIRPEEVCRYTADQVHPWHYSWIGFTGACAAAFDRAPDVFEADRLLFEEIREASRYSSTKDAYLVSILFRLYCALFDRQERPDYVSRAVSYIKLHYMKPLRIEEIADRIGVSRKYLSRLFKERTGATMQQFLLQKRMAEAKQLLSEGYRVEETAYLIGYSDGFAFSKAYKKYWGHAPSREFS